MKTTAHAAIILREKLFEMGGSIFLRGRAAWKIRGAIKEAKKRGWLTHEVVEAPDGERFLMIQEKEGASQ